MSEKKGLIVRMKMNEELVLHYGDETGRIKYFERNGNEIALRVESTPNLRIDRPKWLAKQKAKE